MNRIYIFYMVHVMVLMFILNVAMACSKVNVISILHIRSIIYDDVLTKCYDAWPILTNTCNTTEIITKNDAHTKNLINFFQFSLCVVNDDWGLDLPLATIWFFVGFILCSIAHCSFSFTPVTQIWKELQASTKTQ